MLEYLKSWTHLAEIGQSRSSITNPLQWAMVILIGGMVLLILVHTPVWVVATLFACLLLVIVIFAYAFLYFMHTQPDVLRSEHFHLSKMAIERGLVGDSITGLIEPDRLQDSTSKLLTGESPDA